MKILGIETSCDETGIAIYDTEQGLLSHVLHSQIALHADYGGVVPELASRDHIRKTIPLIEQALREANLQGNDIEGIAYTAGPGLLGALMVGATIAQTLAFAWNIPAIAVHHMEAHLLAPLLETNKPTFPFVALLVSGGHTMLVQVDDLGKYKVLGESLDDAAGEAFDKTAKILGLEYPGGPLLARLAETGNPNRYHFPRPMTDRPGLDFSFSGLKTAALNAWNASDKSTASKADIAASFQAAVVDTLLIKCERALQQTGLDQLVMAGGVSANRTLRERLKAMAELHHWQVFYPRHEFCTDNGAMIALTGALRLQRGNQNPDLSIQVRSRWSLEEL